MRKYFQEGSGNEVNQIVTLSLFNLVNDMEFKVEFVKITKERPKLVPVVVMGLFADKNGSQLQSCLQFSFLFLYLNIA